MRGRLRFLSAEQVVLMHGELLRRFGGLEGGGHRGSAYEGVEAAVQAVKNSYYSRLEELAAAYAVHIVQGHVFMDGNKRAGAAAMLTFPEANGAVLRIGAERLAKLMIELQARSEGGEDASRLIEWIAGVLRAPGRQRRSRRRE